MTTTTLFTINELKTTLNIATTVVDYDLELGLLVDFVPMMFEKYLNKKIGIFSRIDKFFANDKTSQTFFLSAYPIESVSSISINSSTTSGYTILNKNFGEITFDDSTLQLADEIAVTYIGGVEPTSLKYPALVQAKYMYMRHQHQHVAVDEEGRSAQNRLIYKNDELLPIVKMFLTDQQNKFM